MSAQPIALPDQARRQAGKYLTFMLAGEQYGLEILKVREIIALTEITAVPRTPRFIRGVINLRGRVVPVMDLRRKFDLPLLAPGPLTCIIVVELGAGEVGILVDRVCDVASIAADDVSEAPAFALADDAAFLLGIGKTAGRVTILLDIEKVFSVVETAELDVAHALGRMDAVAV